jgi:hypothetical protein
MIYLLSIAIREICSPVKEQAVGNLADKSILRRSVLLNWQVGVEIGLFGMVLRILYPLIGRPRSNIWQKELRRYAVVFGASL